MRGHFRCGGAAELRAACDALAPIQTGEAVITEGFALPVKFVIHTAGPRYRDGTQGEAALLRACYLNALAAALERGCESVAFPLISSGLYGYPKAEALDVATAAIGDFLRAHDLDVSLVVPDRAALAVGEGLLGAVSAYIGRHYIEEALSFQAEEASLPRPAGPLMFNMAAAPMMKPRPARPSAAAKLDDLVGRLDEPFSATLLRLIDAKGKTDVEVYKRANLDRRHFSKIRGVPGYMPGKRTAVALAVALELSSDETADLLRRAGYTLSRSVLFDVIIAYFIAQGRYDIFEINEVLFHYDQQTLGG
jgi:O-acetyl-ADP-ribose deacetylase (regulator of RNase III)